MAENVFELAKAKSKEQEVLGVLGDYFFPLSKNLINTTKTR